MPCPGRGVGRRGRGACCSALRRQAEHVVDDRLDEVDEDIGEQRDEEREQDEDAHDGEPGQHEDFLPVKDVRPQIYMPALQMPRANRRHARKR